MVQKDFLRKIQKAQISNKKINSTILKCFCITEETKHKMLNN